MHWPHFSNQQEKHPDPVLLRERETEKDGVPGGWGGGGGVVRDSERCSMSSSWLLWCSECTVGWRGTVDLSETVGYNWWSVQVQKYILKVIAKVCRGGHRDLHWKKLSSSLNLISVYSTLASSYNWLIHSSFHPWLLLLSRTRFWKMEIEVIKSSHLPKGFFCELLTVPSRNNEFCNTQERVLN